MIEDVRHTPDFVVTPRDHDGVYLVEVKYQRELNIKRVVEAAERLRGWTCSWLFIATQEKFYFDSCSSIIDTSELRELNPLNWVDDDRQKYYMALLHKYIAA